MADAGGDQYTFHIEATEDPAGTIKKIKDAGMKVGSHYLPPDTMYTLSFLDKMDLLLSTFRIGGLSVLVGGGDMWSQPVN